MNNLARCAAIAAAALSAVLLAACGSTKVTGPGLEAKMKSEALAPKGITNASVKCPAETEVKVGATVECSVTADGKKGNVTAKFADEEGALKDYNANVDDIQVALIEDNAEETTPGLSKVKCPSSTKPKKGGTYFCIGNIPESGFGVVTITQTSEDSSVRVRLQKRKLKTRNIENNIAKTVRKRFPNAQVECPANVTSQKGSTFTCTVTNPANGRSAKIKFRQKDSEGNFDVVQ
ncbi:MAG TPA: DUF4333 domain-containing protein [Thermoleophilaceae bacterium]|nr:DUF4333 domain-containing protein [Thermoleophilaceae bacterium]